MHDCLTYLILIVQVVVPANTTNSCTHKTTAIHTQTHRFISNTDVCMYEHKSDINTFKVYLVMKNATYAVYDVLR